MGVWTLFPGKNFFPALELVIVLFTNFFTIFPVFKAGVNPNRSEI